MKRLVEEAIEALTALDAARLDALLGELATCPMHPPSREAAQEAIPAQRVLGALLRETERNLRLLRSTSLCGFAEDATGAAVYPAAWRQADSEIIRGTITMRGTI